MNMAKSDKNVLLQNDKNLQQHINGQLIFKRIHYCFAD